MASNLYNKKMIGSLYRKPGMDNQTQIYKVKYRIRIQPASWIWLARINKDNSGAESQVLRYVILNARHPYYTEARYSVLYTIILH